MVKRCCNPTSELFIVQETMALLFMDIGMMHIMENVKMETKSSKDSLLHQIGQRTILMDVCRSYHRQMTEDGGCC